MILRDPLNRVSVRYKLALTFVSICLLAFGVGGYLVSGSAKRALETAILSRLDWQAKAYAVALEGKLSTLVRRTEDFASDGFIRDATEALLGETTPGINRELREDLSRHLTVNKLPLEATFHGLTLIAPSGDLILSAGVDPPPGFLDEFTRLEGPDGPWISGCIRAPGPAGFFRMAVATPLTSRTGTGNIGHLVAWIYPGSWIRGAMISSDLAVADVEEAPVDLELIDAHQRRLVVKRILIERTGPGPHSQSVREGFGLELLPISERTGAGVGVDRDLYTRSFPVERSGWWVQVQLKKGQVMAAVGGLQSRFLGVGVILTAIACGLLFFPLRFLARPLVLLTAAARRIKEGDFSVRVRVDSSDEIGELAHSFNTMAEAVEERTRRLEQTASDLRDRQRDLGFERDRLHAVISSMRDGLIVLDAHGEPVVHNRAAAALVRQIDKVDSELTSRHICAVPDGPEKDCVACLFDSNSPPRSCVLELEGGVYEVHATHLKSSGTASVGRVLVSRDLTDRVAQDEQQIHQERLAVLGEVAAVMAHELNNPLAAISMYNQMNASIGDGNPEIAENTQVIQRNIQACKRAIRELLDYATGSVPQTSCIEIHEVLEDAMAFLRPLAKRSEVVIEIDTADKEAYVMGDEVQIRQIFVNLIVNAIQALGDKGGRVSVRTNVSEDQVTVDIADDGPGMSKDVRDQIFRPFFTTKPRGEGTGLGLPTSLRIAELHGGGIELLSTGDRGTVFRVRLRAQLEPTG